MKSPKIGRVARGVLPWVITVLIFVYIFRQVPVSRVREALELVRFHLFIPLVIALFIFFFLTDTLIHHQAFNWLAAPAGFREVLLARAATYILGVLNFFVGQGGMGYWLARTKKVSPGDAASIIIFIMFMDLLMLIVFSTAGVILMPEVRVAHFFALTSEGTLVRFVFITLAVLLFQVYIWVRKPEGKLVRWLLFRGPFQVFDRVRLRHFAILFGLKLLTYSVDMTGAWLGLKTFGLNISFVHVVTYLPIVYLIGAIPITVLQFGTSQLAWLYFFRGMASPAALLAFSVLWHFVFVMAQMVAGTLCLPRVLDDLYGGL